VSEEAQARSHALQRQLELRAPQPQPHASPQSQLAQLACCTYAAEGSVSGGALSRAASSTSRAASPPLLLSAGVSETLLPHAGEYGAGHGPGERGVEYSAGYGAASWSEQESSPPAGYILPLDARGPGGKTGTRMHGYAPRS
jgi:hypothetical protein